jgi:hypothetical protein
MSVEGICAFGNWSKGPEELDEFLTEFRVYFKNYLSQF